MLGKIGNHEIRQKIGRGAMGVVYEGPDTVIERRVAAKMLRSDQLEPGQLPEVSFRFKRKARLAEPLSRQGNVREFRIDRTSARGPEEIPVSSAAGFGKSRLSNFVV